MTIVIAFAHLVMLINLQEIRRTRRLSSQTLTSDKLYNITHQERKYRLCLSASIFIFSAPLL